MDMITADCGTGKLITRPLTSDEIAAVQAAETAVVAEKAARNRTEAQRRADVATLMATLPNQAAKDATARLFGLPSVPPSH